MAEKVVQESVSVTEEIAEAVVQARVIRDSKHKYLGIRIDLTRYQGDPFALAFKVAALLPPERTSGGPWEKVVWEREIELSVGGTEPVPVKNPGRHIVCFIRCRNLHLVPVESDTAPRSEP